MKDKIVQLNHMQGKVLHVVIDAVWLYSKGIHLRLKFLEGLLKDECHDIYIEEE